MWPTIETLKIYVLTSLATTGLKAHHGMVQTQLHLNRYNPSSKVQSLQSYLVASLTLQHAWRACCVMCLVDSSIHHHHHFGGWRVPLRIVLQCILVSSSLYIIIYVKFFSALSFPFCNAFKHNYCFLNMRLAFNLQGRFGFLLITTRQYLHDINFNLIRSNNYY